MPTCAEYLAECILNHIEGDDAGTREHAAAIEVIEYLTSPDGADVLAAINFSAHYPVASAK